MSGYIFNPIYPNAKFKTFCYIKSVVTNPNIIVADYSYYEDMNEGQESFEKTLLIIMILLAISL